MPLFSRRPRLLPLSAPRLEEFPQPDAGSGSFAAATIYQTGYREAFEPEAHEVSDLLAEVIDAATARAQIVVAAEDEPYLRQVFISAARIGAGIGLVERRGGTVDEHHIDRDIEGALREAVGALPSMSPEQHRVARYLLRSGHYVARTGPQVVRQLLTELRGRPGRGYGDGDRT